jgi:hypothetical protein
MSELNPWKGQERSNSRVLPTMVQEGGVFPVFWRDSIPFLHLHDNAKVSLVAAMILGRGCFFLWGADPLDHLQKCRSDGC